MVFLGSDDRVVNVYEPSEWYTCSWLVVSYVVDVFIVRRQLVNLLDNVVIVLPRGEERHFASSMLDQEGVCFGVDLQLLALEEVANTIDDVAPCKRKTGETIVRCRTDQNNLIDAVDGRPFGALALLFQAAGGLFAYIRSLFRGYKAATFGSTLLNVHAHVDSIDVRNKA